MSIDRRGSGGRHELGQNFLVDRRVVRAIVDAVPTAPALPVLELGAGDGAVTAESFHDPNRVQKKYKKLYSVLVAEPHGPIKISVNRQIALPKALLDRVRLEPGDCVYVLQSDDEPSSLVVVPVERVTEWMRAGRQQDGRERVSRSEEVEGYNG